MVYLNKVNGDEPVVNGKNISQQAPQQSQKDSIVVPVGQKQNENAQDSDKLPQGFYVEKSQDTPLAEPTEAPAEEVQETPTAEPTEVPEQDDDDSDIPDTKMHIDERIEMSESITIASDEIRPIEDALDNAVRRGQNAALKQIDSDGEIDAITSAETMMKYDTFQPLNMDYKKGWHAVGLARFEHDNFKYTVEETDSSTKWISNSERIDIKGTYESKTGNTKLFGYLKGATTNNNITISTPEENENSKTDAENGNNGDKPDIPPIPDVLNMKSNSKEYCIYMGLKQKFKNGDVLSATGFYDKNEEQLVNTTQFDALYDMGFADITGNVSVYQIADNKATVKTNLSCKFKTPEPPEPEPTDQPEEQTTQNEDEEKNPQEVKTDGKKWHKKSGLLLEFESEDDHEQGIGYYWDFKKNAANSKTKFTFFGKGSTTQRGNDEKSSYHITAGANLQYREKINSKTLFDLNLDAKNKLTFGGEDKGNITTAFGTARINKKNKFFAELEGKLILARDTYKALALRLAYKFSPKVEVSAEAALIDQNECGARLRGYSGLTSVHVNL